MTQSTRKLNGDKKVCVYLTGSTGFLGGFIARSLQAKKTVDTIYCPIREKKGVHGADRFKSCLGFLSKCVYVHIDNPLPSNTTHVILNAYNTRFDESLQSKLEGNVAPIISILEQCKRRQNTIQGISFVSTAFVLPPMPYESPKLGRIPFLLCDQSDITASQLYNSVLKNEASIERILPNVCSYYRQNSYVFSKHILEHLIKEQFPELPVCIIRPSIISPSTKSNYGFDSKAALPLIFKLAPHYVMMAPNCSGLINFVFIEDATNDVIEGTMKHASQAQIEGNHGCAWHPIIQSVSHSNVNAYTMFREIAPNVPRLDIRNDTMRHLVRTFEFMIVWLFYGRALSQLLQVIYMSYDFFLANTWDFDPRYPDDVWKRILDNGKEYLKLKSMRKALPEKEGKAVCSAI